MESILSSISTGSLQTRISLLEQEIGHTPLHRFSSIFSKKDVYLFGKKEWMQLSGSVKARAAYNIILSAVESGRLDATKSLLDATSGNTGIAYATIGARAGFAVTLCLPENASKERREILESLGVHLILTSKFEGTDGAQEVAMELAIEKPSTFYYADQYKNENNWKAHYFTTAPEIYREVPEITHFVAGLGTTGTFVGTGRRLKELAKDIQLVSLQPDLALHGMEGWKHLETAVVPTIYDSTLADQNLEVSTDEAYEMIKTVYKCEGILLSPSSAANLAGAIRIAEKLDHGTVVTVLPDNGDKYSEVLKKIL